MTPRHPGPDAIRVDAVLSALGNPVRLAAVRSLDKDGDRNCGALLTDLGVTAKSTMTHHWRVLRDAGVIWQHQHGREYHLSVRRVDLDARYPGLLDAILAGAARDEE